MSSILRKFPNEKLPPRVVRAEGLYVFTEDGRMLTDFTSGTTTCGVLGYSHPAVLDAMRKQMERFCHIDYNAWVDPALEDLARLLLSRAPPGLDKVYFSGNSGSESIEAAMKLSYQVHHDSGQPGRTHYISREQSFHGATLHGISMSELPILEFYGPILPDKRAKIPQHNPLRHRRVDETLEDYTSRSAKDLEARILEIGPERVCAFIGETMLGSLVGDVPPAPGYWKAIREVCDCYGVHLILDEIYCGLGRSGKVYCCEWDDVVPDFVCIGKNLGAGHAPLSAVVTKSVFEEVIAKGQGRIQHGHTHQGYSLGVAAALAVQGIVQTDEVLSHIEDMGRKIRITLQQELGSHPFVTDVRGRGLLSAIEYDCRNRPAFSTELGRRMNERHQMVINAKWHRVSITPPYIVTAEQIDRFLEAFIDCFKETAGQWAAN